MAQRGYTVREVLAALQDEDLNSIVQIRSVEDGAVVQTSDLTEIDRDLGDGVVTLIGEIQ